MISSLPPGFIMVLGALLVPFLPHIRPITIIGQAYTSHVAPFGPAATSIALKKTKLK